MPTGRSVCPACGTLQRSEPASPAADPTRLDVPIAGEIRRARAAALGTDSGEPTRPVAPARALDEPKVRPPSRRDSGRRTMVAMVVTIAVLGAAVAGAIAYDGRSAGDSALSAVSTTNGAEDGTDPRVASLRSYCTSPRGLGTDAGIAPFVPGEGAIALVTVPRPATSTDPATELVLEVAPDLGEPRPTLDGAASLVSLVVCFDQPSTERTEGSCDYELTTPGAIGERRTAPLLRTTYRGRIHDATTGDVLAEAPVSTPVDRCPDFAFVGSSGVSLPLNVDAVLVWLAQRMPEVRAG